MTGDRFLWHHDTSFFQQDEINGYAGGVHRRFAPLGEAARKFAEDFVNSPGTREIVTEEDFGIGCHQIRITADDTVLGRPAPEGFHHDGFDVVGVTCVAVENVSGGISLVRETSTSPDAGEIILERVMAPGETLYVSDGEVLHYVTPFTPKVPGLPAWRDVVVVTFRLGAEVAC